MAFWTWCIFSWNGKALSHCLEWKQNWCLRLENDSVIDLPVTLKRKEVFLIKKKSASLRQYLAECLMWSYRSNDNAKSAKHRSTHELEQNKYVFVLESCRQSCWKAYCFPRWHMFSSRAHSKNSESNWHQGEREKGGHNEVIWISRKKPSWLREHQYGHLQAEGLLAVAKNSEV